MIPAAHADRPAADSRGLVFPLPGILTLVVLVVLSGGVLGYVGSRLNGAVMLAAFLLYAAVLLWGTYFGANFSHAVVPPHLILEWRIFKVVPFSRLRIPVGDILESRPFVRRRDKWGGYWFGNPLATDRTVVLILRRRRLLFKRINVTSADPSRLLADIREGGAAG